MDWPLSTVGEAGVIAAADKGPFTVTVTTFEETDSSGVPVSFTWSSNDQTPVTESAPLVAVGTSPALQLKLAPRLAKLVAPGAFCFH